MDVTARLAAGVTCLALCASTASAADGWIDFALRTKVAIYVPIRVNGRDAMGLLNPGEPSSIDTGLAASLATPTPVDANGALSGLVIEAGGVSVRDISAKPDDMFTTPVALLSRAYPFLGSDPIFKPFLLGDEFFRQVAVDIDFAHHRLAFRDPHTMTRPTGAVEVPLIDSSGVRTVPVSINGSTPSQFALHVSNVLGPVMATPSYVEQHGLIGSHATSLRLSQPFKETIVTIDRLSFAGVDFSRLPLAVIPDSQVPPIGINGDLGLPVLATFDRIVIDYMHNRLFAIAGKATGRTPMARDRIGMVLYLGKVRGHFGVAYVSPNSPAEAAGFKAGDIIETIDGKAYDEWPAAQISSFEMTESGTSHTFVMADGSVRQVEAKDFF